MTKESLVYLISPVQQVSPEQAEIISAHTECLKKQGVKLFNPIENAPQEDKTGFNMVMAELYFLQQASIEEGRVDILWNAGGIPSERSRVGLGMAFALGLEFNLVTVFNEEQVSGPQLGLTILKELNGEKPLDVLWQLYGESAAIKNCQVVVIDWEVDMTGQEQEWQRIRLGLALGHKSFNPRLKIMLGKLVGEDPKDNKSYVKVIREIEQIQEAG